VKIVTIAIIHAGIVGFVVALLSGLLVVFAGIPAGFALYIGSSIGLIIAAVVFLADVQEARAELRRTGSVTFPKEFLPSGLFSSTSRSRAQPSSGLLPSGYSRSEYRDYGATDDDIEFWGLDQPGAPPPEAAGWVVMDMLAEMDADGDGFIDDPFDDPFF
jgi:hypothetical protein